jgi:hypothetical protein
MIKFISTQNMRRSCVWVKLKTNKNWHTRLFEFILANVEISGSFDGFIHIRNWVLQNMNDNCFLENRNMNLDIQDVDIRNLNIQNMDI